MPVSIQWNAVQIIVHRDAMQMENRHPEIKSRRGEIKSLNTLHPQRFQAKSKINGEQSKTIGTLLR